MENFTERVFNCKTNETFFIGKLLGRGGFANCYEIIDSNKNIFAVKKLNKSRLSDEKYKTQFRREILIHEKLNHENIVQFQFHFEDSRHYYIILELCLNETLAKLKKLRQKITEPETRYFTKQIAKACQYLHEKKIIHRDLKLENIFFNNKMIVKLGDFGLSAQLKSANDKVTSTCGTPNYISPEVILNIQYSYDADAWSLGVIIYKLITGINPFKCSTMIETFNKIKRLDYVIPSEVNLLCKNVIKSLLHKNPNLRPSMKELLEYPFFQKFTPNVLPISVLSKAPRFDNIPVDDLTDEEKKYLSKINSLEPVKSKMVLTRKRRKEYPITTFHSKDLIKKIKQMLNKINILTFESDLSLDKMDWLEKTEDPVLDPVFWIGKWIDCNKQHGFGYQLNDGSTGVLFNDKTRLILTGNEQNLQFINSDDSETLFTVAQHPANLKRKLDTLQNFHRYMTENLSTTGNSKKNSEEAAMERVPFVKYWLRSNKSIIMQLDNGCTQINFLNDHTKLILCPLMSAVSYIDENKMFKTFPFLSLRKYGITQRLFEKFEESIEMLEALLNPDSQLNRLE